MKKSITIFLFIFLFTASYSQVIKGTVADMKTKNAIGFASVYFNGTFVGTTSDMNAQFELNISNYSGMPLTISAIGYYSVSISDFSKKEVLHIYLKPKDYHLNEVVVKTKSLKSKRKKYLALFRAEFLGSSDNARQCKILNEDDILFYLNTNKDTLMAYALKPIQIDNRALGYKISFYMDKFEYHDLSKTTYFIGNIIFNEDVKKKGSQNRIDDNRKYAYLGSRMHFFRSLWSDNLTKNEFTVSGSDSIPLKCTDIVGQDYDRNNFLKHTGELRIDYNSKISYITFISVKRITHITFLKEYVYFDKTGYFDPSGISWKGAMGEQRIADLLPYEYTCKE